MTKPTPTITEREPRLVQDLAALTHEQLRLVREIAALTRDASARAVPVDELVAPDAQALPTEAPPANDNGDAT